MIIEGIDAAERICKFALHFDRHDPLVSATELHAHYHWQFGGNRLDGQDCGTLLQLQGPRFPWHPLDPVLLVDFVLGHFNGPKRTELMESEGLTRYPRILYNSQTRLVAPFFAELHQALSAAAFCPDALLAVSLRFAGLIRFRVLSPLRVETVPRGKACLLAHLADIRGLDLQRQQYVECGRRARPLSGPVPPAHGDRRVTCAVSRAKVRAPLASKGGIAPVRAERSRRRFRRRDDGAPTGHPRPQPRAPVPVRRSRCNRSGSA